MVSLSLLNYGGQVGSYPVATIGFQESATGVCNGYGVVVENKANFQLDCSSAVEGIACEALHTGVVGPDWVVHLRVAIMTEQGAAEPEKVGPSGQKSDGAALRAPSTLNKFHRDGACGLSHCSK